MATPVRVVVVANFENGADVGDKPGEYQASIGDEAPGQIAAYEANHRVGAPVVRELLKDWSRYRNAIPQAALK